MNEESLVTDFIQVGNPRLREIAKHIRAKTARGIVSSVSKFVAKNVEYPLDYRGRPSAARSARIFRWWNGFYLTDVSTGYGWLLPNQTVSVEKGICVDTACLCTTLLRIKEIDARTILGAVLRSKDQKFIGLHAWTEFTTEKGSFVIETTVHPKPAPPIPCDALYGGKEELTYDPIAWFSEREYHEDLEKVKHYGEIL